MRSREISSSDLPQRHGITHPRLERGEVVQIHCVTHATIVVDDLVTILIFGQEQDLSVTTRDMLRFAAGVFRVVLWINKALNSSRL
jgi:dihydrodipicolinate reductase